MKLKRSNHRRAAERAGLFEGMIGTMVITSSLN